MPIDCDEILPGILWVGTFVRPGEIDGLLERHITTVVSLQTDGNFAYCGVSADQLTRALSAAGIALRRVPVEDFSADLLARKLPECVVVLAGALAPEGARVYLHCTAGMNRSPTVAAGYLIQARGATARLAHDYVRTRRRCRPYLSVLEQFEEYTKQRDSGPSKP